LTGDWAADIIAIASQRRCAASELPLYDRSMNAPRSTHGISTVTRRRERDIRSRALRFVALAFALALVPVALDADSLDTAEPDTTNITGSLTLASPDSLDVLPAVNDAFRPGESLKFSVQYGPIHAGSAYLEVPEVSNWNGHKAYLLVARAESNTFFSQFYRVRNRIESRWDSVGRFSLRYLENRREGGTKAVNEIVFDHDKGEAIYKDGEVFPIPLQVQDALSSFYFTRLQALPLGGSVVFDYHASRKSQPMEVRVLGRDRVSTPAGTFDCVVIEPVLKAGGIFKNKGRLVIWLTEDERRIPVLMRSKVAVGSISVILQKVHTGG
jgi:hypothetical protein